MTDWNRLIPDFGLTADQLLQKHDPEGNGDRHHPEFTKWDWCQIVAKRSTVDGYWTWVRDKLNDAQDELDRDSPYNIGEAR